MKPERQLLLPLALGLLCCASALGQPIANATGADFQRNDNALFESARGLLQSGDLAAAETALFKTNRNVGGTGAWYLEAGQRLASLASSFASRKDPAAARVAGLVAIDYLLNADAKLAAEGKMASAAYAQVTIARLHKRVLFNDGAAIEAYRAALKRDPASQTALSALAAWAETEAKLKDKNLVSGGGRP